MTNPPSYITLGNMFFDVWLLWFSFILVHRSGVLYIHFLLFAEAEREGSQWKKYYDSKSFVNGE